MRVYSATLSKWGKDNETNPQLKIIAPNAAKAVEKGTSVARKLYADRVLSITEIIPEAEVATK